MIGKCTHVVDCRETMGMGEGGGIAQRGHLQSVEMKYWP